MTVPPLCQALSRVDHASTPFTAFWGQYYIRSAALCSAFGLQYQVFHNRDRTAPQAPPQQARGACPIPASAASWHLELADEMPLRV